MTKIRIEALTMRFGTFTALDGIDLHIEPGEFLGLLGPSGCGKTTTLNIIAGFESPTSGRILLDGSDLTGVPANRRGMGIVFQNYALFPHMTVAENVSFGLEMRKVPKGERKERVASALALVHLGHLAARYPRQLSGGQQQRVALARALVIEPSLLLLDEPLSNLDAKLREAMQVELRAIQRRVGITTVMVTHDQSEALAICDRIAVMDRGRIIQLADPLSLYDEPRNEFAAHFVGRSSRFLGHIVSAERASAKVRLAGCPELIDAKIIETLPSKDVLVALRPEKLRLNPPGAAALQGTVSSRVFQGSSWLFSVETPAGTAYVCELHQGRPAFGEGDNVSISWRNEDAVLLPWVNPET